MKWLKDKDSSFYNKYFGGVTIITNHGGTDFEKAWKNCADNDKELFTTYQISYSYSSDMGLFYSLIKKDPVLSQINFERSFILQELTYSVACIGPAVADDIFMKCGITITDSDEDIIKKVCSYIDEHRRSIWSSSPRVWNGAHNRWSLDVKDSQPNIMLKYIEENGDRGGYEYDWDEELFIGGGEGVGASSKWYDKYYNGLKKFFNNIGSFWSELLTGEEYTNILDDKYWTKMQEGASLKDEQADWVLSAMFAYNDEDETTNYEIDDEYFKLMFQEMFSSSINNSKGSGVIGIYLNNKATNPLEEDSDSKIITKYSKNESPVIVLSTKYNTKVKAIAEGKVIKKGYDADYGGYYIMIQHQKCVSIYGNLTNITVQKNAKVKEGDVIGNTHSNFYFALKTKAKGNYLNPTTVIEQSSGTFTVPANGMEIPLMSQFDYPSPIFKNGDSISNSGCGFTSCAMVASYLTKKTITPLEIAKKFGDKYFVIDSNGNSIGMSWGLVYAVAKEYGLGNVTETMDPKTVLTALSEGKPVISSQKRGVFTNGGHIIVLRGVDENGNIWVNDPASKTRSNQPFDFMSQVHVTSANYWIIG